MTEGHTERLEAALDGKYRVERKLGEGGMATVYLAEDIKHGRKSRLKGKSGVSRSPCLMGSRSPKPHMLASLFHGMALSCTERGSLVVQLADFASSSLIWRGTRKPLS